MPEEPVFLVAVKSEWGEDRTGRVIVLEGGRGRETVLMFGRPEELAERLEPSGYDILASEIVAGMELHLPAW